MYKHSQSKGSFFTNIEDVSYWLAISTKIDLDLSISTYQTICGA